MPTAAIYSACTKPSTVVYGIGWRATGRRLLRLDFDRFSYWRVFCVLVGMKTLLLWFILLVLCWPLAIVLLILFPLIWLLLLPFQLIGFAVGGIFKFIGALFMLPYRLIR